MAPWAGQSLVEASLAALRGRVRMAGDRDEVVDSACGNLGLICRRSVAAHPVLDGFFGGGAGWPGVASQLGKPPVGDVISWTHSWMICGDWLTVAARLSMPLPSGCSKTTA